MKNIQSWEKFNETYSKEVNAESINEGVIGDILKLPFKLLGFILKPITSLIGKLIYKSLSVETKWKAVSAIFTSLQTVSLGIAEAKQTLKKNENLTPNEKRELEKKISKFKAQYPEGFNFNKEKQKVIDELEKAITKVKDEKKKEDLEWLLKKTKAFTPKKRSTFSISEIENIIIDFD
jgi:hypothetical protein